MEFTTFLRAAFPSNPTLEGNPREKLLRAVRAYHPLWGTVQVHDLGASGFLLRIPPIRGIARRSYPEPFGPRLRGLRAELIPVQSPLLRESLLVSFPPLIDMLKFSG